MLINVFEMEICEDKKNTRKNEGLNYDSISVDREKTKEHLMGVRRRFFVCFCRCCLRDD